MAVTVILMPMNMPQAKSGHNINGQSGKAQGGSRPRKSAAGKTGKSAVRRTVRKKRKPRKVTLGVWTAVGISLALVMALTFIFIKNNSAANYETGTKVPPGDWRFGIDISHHNGGEIVWDSLFVMTDRRGRTIRNHHLAKDIRPVSFVFVKATEGASMVDRDFRKNWRNAGKSGLRRGAYHFFRSSKDGKIQAELFIKTVGDLRFKDLPPVLDIETIHRGGSMKKLNEEALKWLETIEGHYGKKPIVYTGSSFARDWLSKRITDNYPVWIAHYEKDRPDFDGWIFWQFTDKAVVKGVPGPVDLSVMKR